MNDQTKHLALAIIKEQRHQKKFARFAAMLTVGVGKHLHKHLKENPIQPRGWNAALDDVAKMIGYERYTPEVGAQIDAEHAQRLARIADEDQK